MSINAPSMISGPVGPATGGRFEFEDGGLYVGAWEDGKAHGYGICTGPKNQGEYDGLWQYGFEASGVYTWPSNHTYAGQWGAGKRNGLGVENKGRWTYKGEWTFGFKGRYGVRESNESGASYEGTWTTGLQDGYGVETYADHGTYSGQWMRGARHGYGTRRSATFGVAARYSSTHQRSSSITSLPSHDDADKQLHERDKVMHNNRGGFVLTGFSDAAGSNVTLTESNNNNNVNNSNNKTGSSTRSTSLDKQTGSVRKSLFKRLKKQKSTGDIALESQSPNARNVTGSLRSTASSTLNYPTDSSLTLASKKSNSSFVHHGLNAADQLEPNVVEIYLGEWKNDKRSGFGVCERSDGLKYEGEWYNNKKNGYGRTTYRDGRKEEGKYKNNVLIASEKKHKFLLLRLSKLKERVDSAVHSAKQASEIALQKAEIASARQQTARACGDDAEKAASEARCNAEFARQKAREYGYTPNAGASPNGRPNAASAQAEQHAVYESRFADADFRPGDKADMLLRSTILQDHFDRYTVPSESSKPQAGRSASSGPALTPTATPNSVPGFSVTNSTSNSGSNETSTSQTPNNTPNIQISPADTTTAAGKLTGKTSVVNPNTNNSNSLHGSFSQVANEPSIGLSTTSLLNSAQSKVLPRYSTVTTPAPVSTGSSISIAESASKMNSAPAMSAGWNAKQPTSNHVHQRGASLTRSADGVAKPNMTGTLPFASAGVPATPSVTPPVMASTPQITASTNTLQSFATIHSIPETEQESAKNTSQTLTDAAFQYSTDTLVKRTQAATLQHSSHAEQNNMAKGNPPNSVSSSSSSLTRKKRRGSLPDASGHGSLSDSELQRLRDEVLRRREQERAWRATPVGFVVHRINRSMEWCNRHTGFVVVLAVLSINFLFICIFLSYYNDSFGRTANNKQNSRE